MLAATAAATMSGSQKRAGNSDGLTFGGALESVDEEAMGWGEVYPMALRPIRNYGVLSEGIDVARVDADAVTHADVPEGLHDVRTVDAIGTANGDAIAVGVHDARLDGDDLAIGADTLDRDDARRARRDHVRGARGSDIAMMLLHITVRVIVRATREKGDENAARQQCDFHHFSSYARFLTELVGTRPSAATR
jgi:hypothetical protein